MEVKFRVKQFLDENGKTAYGLQKASGLSKTTVYAITGGQMDGVQFKTLEKLMVGLEQLVGRPIEFADIFEAVRA